MKVGIKPMFKFKIPGNEIIYTAKIRCGIFTISYNLSRRRIMQEIDKKTVLGLLKDGEWIIQREE